MQHDMMMRGLSARTQHQYVRNVQRFAAFLKRPPDTATSEDLRSFQIHQHDAGASVPTINGTVSALRFLYTVTLRRRDLARGLVATRRPHTVREVLSVEEAARLLEAALGIKYKAALGVAYGAGLRVSEVAHLKVDDIDSQRMLIRVEQGKGGRDRNAMLSPQLLELLQIWWRKGKRRGVMFPHGWLFPGRSYTDPISAWQLHRAVQEAAEVAGIKRRISPHKCATASATHLLEQDVDSGRNARYCCLSRGMDRDPRQHSLAPGELQKIYETEVAPPLFKHAKSVEHTTAILVGGQPGAGRTPAVIAAAQEFTHQSGLVWIVGDDLRRHLPQYASLQCADDTTAGFYSDRDSGRLVEMALRDAASRKTNVLVEGTLRNPEVVARTLTDLRAAGFSTELRVLAVQPELSSLRILQRYALQKERRGTGRMTTAEAHAAALSGIPKSLDRVQDERLADRLLIFQRGGELLEQMELSPAAGQSSPRASAIVRAEQAKPLSTSERAYVDRELDRLIGGLERHGIPAAELRARVKGAERSAAAQSNADLAAKFRHLSQEERLRTAGLRAPALALEKVNAKIDQTYPPGSPQNATLHLRPAMAPATTMN